MFLRVFFKQPLSTLKEHLFIIITFYAAVHSTSPWKIEYQITSQETRLSYFFFINLIVFPCVPTRQENLCDLNINIFPPDSIWLEGIYFYVNSRSKSYAFPVTKYFSTNYLKDAIKNCARVTINLCSFDFIFQLQLTTVLWTLMTSGLF